jgi:four helix bundle protein
MAHRYAATDSYHHGHKVKNFEDLHVYRRARELTNEIYRLTRRGSFSRDYALAAQVRRAAVSIMSNIAEGFERGSNAELRRFLFTAKGSCGEVRAHLTVAHDQGYVDNDDYGILMRRCQQLGAMLANFANYLRKCPYKDRTRD